MASETERFITQFHNLPGVSVAERNKSLFQLIATIPSNHDDVLAELIPKTHLEKLFYIELLLKLERFDELIETLKSGEEELARKVLKNKKFCQKLAKTVEDNQGDFVNAVLPLMSYVLRMRLIKEFAKFGERMDRVFDAILIRYGIHNAINILVGCSSAKIKEVLVKYNVKLPLRHQQILLVKDRELFKFYVKSRNEYDESVFHFVAARDINFWFELSKDNIFNCGNLGKRLTSKFLKIFRTNVIKDATSFVKVIHLKIAFKLLGDEAKLFYFNCFSKEKDNLRYDYASNDVWNFGKLFKENHYEVFCEGLKIIYNIDIYEHPELFRNELFEVIPVKEREKWVEIKNNTFDDLHLIKYLGIEKSIPLIKSKINVTSSVNSRLELLEILVRTCKINCDFVALAEVLDYVTSRHRNDDIVVLDNFLNVLNEEFYLEKLEELHWKSINTLLSILEMKNHQFRNLPFLFKHIQFLFNQKLPILDLAIKYLKLVKNNFRWLEKSSDIEFSKSLLLIIIDHLPEVMENDENIEDFDIKLIYAMINWNQDHPEHAFTFTENVRLLQSFNKVVEKTSYNHWELVGIFTYFICTKTKWSFRDQILYGFLKFHECSFDQKILLWFLKHEPKTISDHTEFFLKYTLETFVSETETFLWIKKYSHLNLPQNIVQKCLQLVPSSYNGRLFLALAILTEPQEFLKLTSTYRPSKYRFDHFNEEERKEVSLVSATSKSFKYSKSFTVLPTLLQYCKGDFLGDALESLYYLFYHSPENKLSDLIEELADRAVSVRKHSIFLTCIVGSVADVLKIFKRFSENEKNVSVLKHLFGAILKYFIKNPSEDVWEFVKFFMLKLDSNDSESFRLITQSLCTIPKKFQPSYVQFGWKFLNEKKELEEIKWRFLRGITSELVSQLDFDFIKGIIEENFLIIGKNYKEYEINSFVYQCLTEMKNDAIFPLVFDILTKYKVDNYNTIISQKLSRKIVFNFVNNFFDSESIDLNVLSKFSGLWYKIFTPTEAVEEHLMLSLYSVFLNNKVDLIVFSEKILNYLHSEILKFGSGFVEIFANVLNKLLNGFLSSWESDNDSENLAKFCWNCFEKRQHHYVLSLIIEILPRDLTKSSISVQNSVYALIEALKGISDDLLQMHLNIYLRSLE